jgi:hypothetical protein
MDPALIVIRPPLLSRSVYETCRSTDDSAVTAVEWGSTPKSGGERYQPIKRAEMGLMR